MNKVPVIAVFDYEPLGEAYYFYQLICFRGDLMVSHSTHVNFDHPLTTEEIVDFLTGAFLASQTPQVLILEKEELYKSQDFQRISSPYRFNIKPVLLKKEQYIESEFYRQVFRFCRDSHGIMNTHNNWWFNKGGLPYEG